MPRKNVDNPFTIPSVIKVSPECETLARNLAILIRRKNSTR